MRMLLPVGRSGWALAAGYVGLFSFLIVPGPAALVLGIVALIDIRKSRQTDQPKHGTGRALFALVIGGIATVFLLFLVINAATR